MCAPLGAWPGIGDDTFHEVQKETQYFNNTLAHGKFSVDVLFEVFGPVLEQIFPSPEEKRAIIRQAFELHDTDKSGLLEFYVIEKNQDEMCAPRGAWSGMSDNTVDEVSKLTKMLNDNCDGKFSIDELFKMYGQVIERTLARVAIVSLVCLFGTNLIVGTSCFLHFLNRPSPPAILPALTPARQPAGRPDRRPPGPPPKQQQHTQLCACARAHTHTSHIASYHTSRHTTSHNTPSTTPAPVPADMRTRVHTLTRTCARARTHTHKRTLRTHKLASACVHTRARAHTHTYCERARLCQLQHQQAHSKPHPSPFSQNRVCTIAAGFAACP